MSFDADISSDDTAIVERGEALLHDLLRITAELGGNHLTGALYSALGKYHRPLSDAGRRNVVAVLRRLARDRGMTVGLEICNRYETNVVNTARQALALADDIGEDNVFLYLDTYHMNIEEDDLVRPVREVGDRLVTSTSAKTTAVTSDQVISTSPRFFHALIDIHYTGPITFESFSSAVLAAGLSNDLAIWRNLWSNGVDLARLDPDERIRRLIARHVRFGKDPTAALAWACGTDERNVALINLTRSHTDLIVPASLMRSLGKPPG